MICSCNGKLIKGWSKNLKRYVWLCTSCRRAIFIDHLTGRKIIVWKQKRKEYNPDEFFKKVDKNRGKVDWSIKGMMEHSPSLAPEKFKKG